MDEFKWFFVFLAVMAVFAFGSFAVMSYTESQTATACIESGGSWVNVKGSIYECQR